MSTIQTQSSVKRRKRKNKRKIRTAEHPLMDGDALLFRTPPSGNVWQFQMWIREEQKYLRKSTRTKNLEQAITVGREFFLSTNAKLRNQESIFPKTVQQVVDHFLEVKKNEIGINKTKGRWVTIRSQLKHLVEFIGADTYITEIPSTKWEEYFSFRRKHHPEVVNTTLGNEKNTIRSLFRFAIRNRYIPPSSPLPEFPHIPRQSRKREAFSLDEWKTIYNFLKSNKWMKDESDKIVEQRTFIRYFILTLINCGARFGEVRRLKWKNIKVIRRNDKKSEKEIVSVKISFDASQTKNNKARVVIGRRGDVFEKLKRFSNHTHPNDYVFVDNDTGSQITRDTYYKHWHYMVNETGIDEGRADTTFYCLRHTYATWRLYAQVDVFTLARNLGTSVNFIENHYGQTQQELKVKYLTQDFQRDESGQFLYD